MILKPEEGWEQDSVYLVDVSFNKNNPVHRSVLFSGILHNGEPQNYHMICNPSYERNFKLSDVYYLKVVRKLASEVDFTFNYLLPDDL